MTTGIDAMSAGLVRLRLRALTGSRRHIGGASSRMGLALLAACLVLFFQWRSGNFVTYDNFIAILVNSSSILVASIAAARLLVAGAIDLSMGGTFALVAVISAAVARDTGNPVLAIAVAVFLGGAIGAFNGTLVRLLRISPLIVTLGLLAVYRGLALVLTNAVSITGLPESFKQFGRAKLLGVPSPVLISVAVFIVGGLLMTRTVGGLRSYAVGGNPSASRLSGIDVDRHLLLLFVYLGASIGLMAALATARLGTGSPTIGGNFEFDVLTAVILGGIGFAGGTGRPIGVFVGVVTISIANAGMIFIGLTNFYQQIAKGLLLLLALAADQLLAARRRKQRSPAAQPRRPQPTDRSAGRNSHQAKAPNDSAPIVLTAEHLEKSYGSVVAVDDVGLTARAGEVLCLVGDNGAGKSTVIKMLSGVEVPDGGVIRLDGAGPVTLASPAEARARGIETVHQDLALCPNLGAAYNLALGREPRRLNVGSLSPLDPRTSVIEAKQRLGQLNIALDDYMRPISEMSGGQRQAVAISRVLSPSARVIILDEPTAALGVNQTESVLGLVRTLADRGAAVIMVTHDVESVLNVSDRVVVLNLGRVIHSGATHKLTDRDLVHLMAGIPIDDALTTSNPDQPEVSHVE